MGMIEDSMDELNTSPSGASSDDDVPTELPESFSVPLLEDAPKAAVTFDDNANGAMGTLVSEDEWAMVKRNQTSLFVELPESSLLVPRSQYNGFESGAPEAGERTAVKAMVEELETMGQDYLELNLDDFAVYGDGKHYGVEMRSLTSMEKKSRSCNLFFDGILSVPGGKQSFFVKRVPIQTLPIGNYLSLDEHTVREDIWIESPFNSRRELYYKLCRPAKEYMRFHEPFLWVADLAKHFVDYLADMWKRKHRVSIHDFRANFNQWLLKIHGKSPVFREWLSKYGRQDFRTAIIANLPFLHKETVGVLSEQQAYVHTFWKETWSFTQYPPVEPTVSSSGGESDVVTSNQITVPPTVVTQYIKDCFEGLPFAYLMEPSKMSSDTTTLRDNVIQERHLEIPHAIDQVKAGLSTATAERIKNIRPGDTLSTGRDVDGHWERQEATGFTDVDRWFVLVQQVNVDKKGRRFFDVIWYYRPVDTLCGVMKYPWANELFLSDHCNCEDAVKVYEEEVLGVHEVDFYGAATTAKDVFCRQMYLSEKRQWITLEDRHRKSRGYSLGSLGPKKTQRSEPCVVDSVYESPGRQAYTYNLRRLLRRRSVEPACAVPPNELIYTDDFVTVGEETIMDECYVRQFNYNEPIPTPYDRDGTGNFFYITHKQSTDWSGTKRISPINPSTIIKSFKQGYDPSKKIPKLRGLDLFCGGGNFGRGLEEGGGIQMKWCNDYAEQAIHTYMANVNPEEVHPFPGSIDIMQRLAIEGRFSKSVPKPGDVDFISGGSPCPGFSKITNDKTTHQQRKNQSLVAAFASMVDLYRPKYALLENVPGIVQAKANKDQDVFSQLICALVGIGYQTSFYLMDANSCGAPQRRARVFLVIAAPGCVLPPKPKESHSQPPETRSQSAGCLPNGQPMTERIVPEATPFKHVTAADASSDLPRIQDAKPGICIPFPDHRVTVGQTRKLQREIYYVPTRPYGMNFAKAWYGQDNKNGKPGSGALSQSEREFYPIDKPTGANGKATLSRVSRGSNAYGRSYPNAFFGTVLTRLSANDFKNGRCFHWSENRVMSLMEARRAQGFRDEDVLLGDDGQQYAIVGNSVAREVALALGAAFRQGWTETLEKKRKRAAAPVNGETVRDSPKKKERHTEPIIIDSTDNDTNVNVQHLPRCSSPSRFIPARDQGIKYGQKPATTTNGASPLNGNGKRRASNHDDTGCNKAQRLSSASLVFTNESNRTIITTETTKTTMTIPIVDVVER